MNYSCVVCDIEHEWGHESDGYHHAAFDEQGRAGKFDYQGHLIEEADEAIVKGDLRVAFTNIGEGWSGDFDPEDPEDENLLRIYISLRSSDGGEPYWEEVDEGSICTSLVANTPAETRRGILEIVMAAADAAVSREEKRISKHLMDEFSYINPEWPEKGAMEHVPGVGPMSGVIES